MLHGLRPWLEWLCNTYCFSVGYGLLNQLLKLRVSFSSFPRLFIIAYAHTNVQCLPRDTQTITQYLHMSNHVSSLTNSASAEAILFIFEIFVVQRQG